MPDAAAQMVHQRPGVAEHDQPADEARGEGLHIGVGPGARSRGDQPPGEQQRAEIQCNPGGAMDNGKRHRQSPAIGLKMWRKRAFDPGGHWRLYVADPVALRRDPSGIVVNSRLIYVVESLRATTNLGKSEREFTPTDEPCKGKR